MGEMLNTDMRGYPHQTQESFYLVEKESGCANYCPIVINEYCQSVRKKLNFHLAFDKCTVCAKATKTITLAAGKNWESGAV